MSLESIFKRQARYQDSMLEAFYGHLTDITQSAQAKVIAQLQKRLSITDGVMDRTPGNLRVLRSLPTMFQDAMDSSGYPRLVDAWTAQFSQQLPFLQDTLEYISEHLKEPLPAMQFTATDLKVLDGVRASTVATLESVVEMAGTQAMQRALFSVGGLDFEEITGLVADRMSVSVAQARTLADTAQNVFFRTASDVQFRRIEEAYPEEKRLYVYSGPDDKITRPFCHRLLQRKRAFTRQEIDAMDNQQLPNVALTGGGWNCRHSFIWDVRSLQEAQAKAA